MQLVSKGSVGHHKAPDSWACNHLSTGISWYFWTFALVAAELVREFTSADRSGQPLIQTLLACRCEPPLLSFGCHSSTCISKPPKHCRVAVSAILQQRWNIKRQHIHKRAGKKTYKEDDLAAYSTIGIFTLQPQEPQTPSPTVDPMQSKPRIR